MNRTMPVQDFTFTSRYPLTGQQIASIVIAAVLPIIGAVFFARESGNPAWWAMLVVSPIAGGLVWWEDRRRKNKAGVTVEVRDGVLTCKTQVESDPAQTGNGVVLSQATAIAYGEPGNKKIVFITGESGTENADTPTVRIPARAFTTGNPVGPALKVVASERNLTIPDRAREYLNR